MTAAQAVKSAKAKIDRSENASAQSCDNLQPEHIQIPRELEPFVKTRLLPGERVEDFEALRQMLLDHLRPTSVIEWLWSLDIVELSWELMRYRDLKHRLLELRRVQAIEAILFSIDGAGTAPDAYSVAAIYARRNAADWRNDPQAATQIERYLALNGVDSIAITGETFVQARDVLTMFDILSHSAQQRRSLLLRELSSTTRFCDRARKFLAF